MAQMLIEKGYDVFGMVRGQANPKIRMIQEETPKLELVEGDLQDLSSLIAAVEQVYEDKIAGGLLPQRRMGEGSDVAKAVRAVAEGLLDYSAGQVLNVDGGFHLRTL